MLHWLVFQQVFLPIIRNNKRKHNVYKYNVNIVDVQYKRKVQYIYIIQYIKIKYILNYDAIFELLTSLDFPFPVFKTH